MTRMMSVSAASASLRPQSLNLKSEKAVSHSYEVQMSRICLKSDEK